MENATKALIIAGAILISIVIISLGIMVVNNARQQVSKGKLTKEEISAFNQQWESYCGENVSAGDVRNMVSAVITSNGAESNDNSNRWVDIQGSDTSGSFSVSTAPLSAQPELNDQLTTKRSNTTYTVQAGYDPATGLIVCMGYWANDQ